VVALTQSTKNLTNCVRFFVNLGLNNLYLFEMKDKQHDFHPAQCNAQNARYAANATNIADATAKTRGQKQTLHQPHLLLHARFVRCVNCVGCITFVAYAASVAFIALDESRA